ncbi:MAG TPA: hypothetical protein VJ743_09740 [Albitalea sp.]|nr:hypothetical protein [Albitalea sp.]
MRTGTKRSGAAVILVAPIAAYAQSGAPHIELYAFGGGLLGGLIGALLACWLCKRLGAKQETRIDR